MIYPSFFLGLLFCKYALFEKFRTAMAKETVCVAVCIVIHRSEEMGCYGNVTILMTPLFIYLFLFFLG